MSFTQPLSVRLFRLGVRPLFRRIYRLTCRVKLVGWENVPPCGPQIIAMNHLALYDPPLVLAFWPYAAEAIGAVNMMEKPLTGHLMRAYGTVPVHRGEFDRSLIDKALAILKAGRPLVVAPEGGRSHTPGLREAKPGVAYLALKANVPILPVGITGTEGLIAAWKSARRPVLTLSVGELFRLPEETLSRRHRRQRLAEHTTLIMHRIAALLPPEYRGVYA